jgi:hypothetical protein
MPNNQIAIVESGGFAYDGNGTLYSASYRGVFKWDDFTSGINEKNELSNFAIYLNPSYNFIYIKSSEGSNNQIYNTLGEIVLTVEHTSQSVQRIDISTLSKGMYFIKIGNMIEKFMKM